jgi:flagellar biosynthesis protein FlhA
VLRSAAVLVTLLGLVPALPAPLFIGIGVCAFVGAHFAQRRRERIATRHKAEHDGARKIAVRRPEMALALVGVDALSIDVGADLYALLAPPNAEALLDRIADVRRALAAELGIVIPGVRLRDDGARDARTYAIRVRDRIAAEGIVRLDRLLAVGNAATLAALPGEATIEPVYGLAAKWLSETDRGIAAGAGALTFDAISIIGSHLSEIVRRHAGELLGRQEFHTLLEHLRASVPSVIKDIGGDVLPIAAAHRVFTHLLKERIWPRDPIAVFETILDAAVTSRDPRELCEAARRVVVPQQFRHDGIRRLRPLIFAPKFENELARMWSPGGGLAPDPATALHVRSSIEAYLKDALAGPHAVVATAALRPVLADFFEQTALRIDVFSYSEIPSDVLLEPAGIIDSPTERAA